MSSLLANLCAVTLCFLVFYFAIIRPERQEFLAARMELQRAEPGWSVVTMAGMRGILREVDLENDMVRVEIAEGVVISLAESGIRSTRAQIADADTTGEISGEITSPVQEGSAGRLG